MTIPINSDKNPSLTTTHASAGRDGKTPVSRRSDDETGGINNPPVEATGNNIDVGRANQMLDLATASQTPRASGNIENDIQARQTLGRLEALLAENPGLALRAQAANLNEMHGALLEIQPT